MVRCPYCDYEGEFTLVKTWKFSYWIVYLYKCPSCGGMFRWQVDPEGRRRSYVMKLGAIAKRLWEGRRR